MPGLGHVNCYALEDERGWTVVDPGMPGPKSCKAMESRFAAAGFGVKDVHTVVVTHSHIDHFGGAGRLRKEAGADVVTSRSFRTWWDPDDVDEDSSRPGTGVEFNASSGRRARRGTGRRRGAASTPAAAQGPPALPR